MAAREEYKDCVESAFIYILAGVVLGTIAWRTVTDKSEWGPVRVRILGLAAVGSLVTGIVEAVRR